jgi:hypothetical protein
MGKRKLKPMRQLIRTSATFELDATQWPSIFIAFADAGWKPPRSRMAHIADGTIVSDDEAREMARVADVLFNAALDDRIWAQPLGRIDFDVFIKVRAFLKDGAFRIA